MARSTPAAVRGNGIITLLSDFGDRDAFVGIMKGVILSHLPDAQLVDLTHQVAPQDVVAAALLLRSAVRYFPPGTVHLAVVDPGVGSTRHAVAVATRRAILVGPDNGLLAPAACALGITRIVEIDPEVLAARGVLRSPISQTFHGRDLFAPVAARLAGGAPITAVGRRRETLVELPLPSCRATRTGLVGEVLHVDRFGNLITNITIHDLAALPTFSPQRVSVTVGRARIRGLVPAYASVRDGALLAIVGSWEQVEIAVRGGNAARRLRAARGTAVRITMRS